MNCKGFKFISSKSGKELKGNHIKLDQHEKIKVLLWQDEYKKNNCSIHNVLKLKNHSIIILI